MVITPQEPEGYWAWAGLLVSLGIFLFYFVLSSLAATYLGGSSPSSSTSSSSEDGTEAESQMQPVRKHITKLMDN
jgi:flagellar basal body-associated protein FliL